MTDTQTPTLQTFARKHVEEGGTLYSDDAAACPVGIPLHHRSERFHPVHVGQMCLLAAGLVGKRLRYRDLVGGTVNRSGRKCDYTGEMKVIFITRRSQFISLRAGVNGG